jgi:diguanylate cyclase (GGDEF)-like protein/PAS domain S-box-containing protein
VHVAYAQALLTSTSDAVIGFDLGGRVQSWNPAAEQLLLWVTDDAVGRAAHELFTVEPPSRPGQILNPVSAGESARGDYWLRRHDGSRIEVDVRAAPIRSDDGSVVGVLVQMADVTIERAERRALRERADLVDDMTDGVASADLDGAVTYWSGGAERLYGWTAAEMIGQPFTRLAADPADVPVMRQRIAAVAAGRSMQWSERRQRRKDGTIAWTAVAGRPSRDIDGVVTGVTFVARDMSEQRATSMELDRVSWQDSLTMLPNRQALLLHVQELATAAPAPNSVAVLLLDIDHLSLVNDSHGYDAGDVVLRLVADRLRETVGPDDFVARFGGDEFAVVVREPGDAVVTGARLLAAVAQPLAVHGARLMMSASAGLVLCPPTPLVDALRNADASMYEAKRAGRARLHVFDQSVVARASTLLQLSGGLRHALRDDSAELSAHYQPIVDLGSDQLVALEALARWRHPELGEIPSGRFVDVAEHTGLAARLDLWTMARAFSDYAALVASDVVSPETRISVNVAAAHLHGSDVTDEILRTAHRAGVVPNQIMIEVTEDSVLRDVGPTRASLERLRAQGTWIAVDDFGTGGSSLANLRQLPVDVLKIDRAFIRNVTTDGEDLAIVAALIDLAHALGVIVIAEGVETPDQRRVLAELKCERAQGYLWSPPVARAELAEVILDVARRGRAADTLSRLRQPGGTAGRPGRTVGREHGLLRMLELRREGRSPATIAAALNVEGFRTPEGLRWHRNTVAKVLAPAARPTRWTAGSGK